MSYCLEPHVAGELGDATELDASTHPPIVTAVEYVLDAPDVDDLIESFPVFLVTVSLAEALEGADLTGFALDEATVRPSIEYIDAYGVAPHPEFRRLSLRDSRSSPDAWLDEQYRLCVSDRMMEVLRRHRLDRCDIESLPD